MYEKQTQVRPIRGATGADITEKTLQNTVDALGLDRSISQLSYVEKRLVMVISLTEQLKNSQGDWGRTIESVANQVRIMHEQWNRLSRAVGNVFYPILERILPYLNAVLMVLTEIFNLIASLLGFKIPEFDYSGLAGASDATIDLIDGMDEAGASVDNLKDKLKGLRGFDKLNVINTPTNSSSNLSAGAGIDPAIMDAFNASFGSYNDMMDEVNMKANQFRDTILDWLGFTDGTYKNLKLIGIVLGTLGGLKIFNILKGLFTGNSLLGKLLGTGGLYTTLKKIFSLFNNGVGSEILKGKLANGLIKLASLNPELLLIAGAILAIGGAFIYAYTHSDEFRKKINTMVTRVRELFQTLYDKVVPICENIWKDIEPIWQTIKDTLMLWVGLVYDYIVLKFENMATIIGGTANIINDIINGDYNKAFEDAKTMANELYTNYKENFDKITDRISNFVKDNDINLSEFGGKVLKWFEELPSKLLYWVGYGITEINKKIFETDWIKVGKDVLKKIFAGLLDIDTEAGNFKNQFYDKIKNKLENTDWWSVGWNVLKGIFAGLGNFSYFTSSWGNSFARGIKDALGIHSPSKLMIDEKIGDYTLQGIEIGMDNELPNLAKQADNIVDKINSSFKNIDPVNIKGNVSTNSIEDLFIGASYNNIGNLPTIYNNQGNSTSFNPTFIIQVGDEEVTRKVLNNLQDMAKTNGKPITITG